MSPGRPYEDPAPQQRPAEEEEEGRRPLECDAGLEKRAVRKASAEKSGVEGEQAGPGEEGEGALATDSPEP